MMARNVIWWRHVDILDPGDRGNYFGIKITVSGNERNENHADTSPLEILKKRYAGGEIDEEEFSRRRKGLEDHS